MGDCLPDHIYQFFREDSMTGIASTVDEDGYPRGAPISTFYALDERTMLMGVQNGANTFINAEREGKIALSFICGGDAAFTIRGRVKVFREKMDSSKYLGLLAVDVISVKSNVAEDVEVTEGVKIRFRSPKWEEFIKKVTAELQSFTLEEVRYVLEKDPGGT
jgi:predicted pyridoxine 5'-phosphate oxidase superfamily flavin-nucleotide-binding protein